MVAEDEAWCGNEGGIAIARGRNPRVKGGIGAYLGLIQETKKGIVAVNLFTVDGPILPDTWYTLDVLMDAFEKGGAA